MNFSTMTDRQRIAISHPCATAADTMQDHFARRIDQRGRILSSIVTVNK